LSFESTNCITLNNTAAPDVSIVFARTETGVSRGAWSEVVVAERGPAGGEGVEQVHRCVVGG
jgi:hypothetical protein